MPLIEGIGDEVVFFIIVSFILKFVIVALYYLYVRNYQFEDNEDTPTNDAPPVYNPHTCPICWGEQVLPLETNCGHLYCGMCLYTLYTQNVGQAIRMGIRCPMCRQEVTLIFICFTNDERNAVSGSELANYRTQVLGFARSYNRRYSTGHRSLWEQIRDAPILLRHFLQDAIEGENFENTFVNIRLFMMILVSGAYLLIPTDFLPEQIFGFLGFLDDILILIVLVLYIAASYRRFVANRPIFEEG